MAYKVTDNAATTLAASISNSPAVTTLILADAANFPVINHGGSGSDYTYVTLYDAANNIENVKVTRRDSGSNTLTIVRGTAAGISGTTDASCLAWSGTTTGVACRLIAHFVNEAMALTVAAHTAQTTDAHDASAISFAPVGSIAATDVQTAIVEVYEDLDSAKQNASTAVTKDSGTGAAGMPVGTTAERPTGAAGKFRFNATLNQFEGHNGSAWGAVGGGATGASGNAAFYENDQMITADYTITAGKNAGTFGPVTINSGVEVTIPSGSVWTIV